MPAPTDPYHVLGVARTADARAIKKAFRKLAQEHHPDRNPDDEAAATRFQAIRTAYEVLSDPEQRQRLDAGPGAAPPFSGDGFAAPEHMTDEGLSIKSKPPSGPTLHTEPRPSKSPDDLLRNSKSWGSLFERFFGHHTTDDGPTVEETRKRRSTSEKSERGEDLQVHVELTFEQALRGGSFTARLDDGTTTAIPVPPGVFDGYVMRLRGRGRKGPAGRRGYLWVTCRVAESDRFERQGDDLFCDVRVSALKALLGGEVVVETAYGEKVRLDLHAGLPLTGATLRVAGHGVHSEEREGDLYVRVAFEQPHLSDQARTRLRAAAEAEGLL